VLAERSTPDPSYCQIEGGARSTRAVGDQPGHPLNQQKSEGGGIIVHCTRAPYEISPAAPSRRVVGGRPLADLCPVGRRIQRVRSTWQEYRI